MGKKKKILRLKYRTRQLFYGRLIVSGTKNLSLGTIIEVETGNFKTFYITIPAPENNPPKNKQRFFNGEPHATLMRVFFTAEYKIFRKNKIRKFDYAELLKPIYVGHVEIYTDKNKFSLLKDLF